MLEQTKNSQMMVNGSLLLTVLVELQPSLSCLSLSQEEHTPLTRFLGWLPLDSETAWSVHTHWTWLPLVALPSSSWLISLGTSLFLHHLPCRLLQRCWYSHWKKCRIINFQLGPLLMVYRARNILKENSDSEHRTTNLTSLICHQLVKIMLTRHVIPLIDQWRRIW